MYYLGTTQNRKQHQDGILRLRSPAPLYLGLLTLELFEEVAWTPYYGASPPTLVFALTAPTHPPPGDGYVVYHHKV